MYKYNLFFIIFSVLGINNLNAQTLGKDFLGTLIYIYEGKPITPNKHIMLNFLEFIFYFQPESEEKEKLLKSFGYNYVDYYQELATLVNSYANEIKSLNDDQIKRINELDSIIKILQDKENRQKLAQNIEEIEEILAKLQGAMNDLVFFLIINDIDISKEWSKVCNKYLDPVLNAFAPYLKEMASGDTTHLEDKLKMLDTLEMVKSDTIVLHFNKQMGYIKGKEPISSGFFAQYKELFWDGKNAWFVDSDSKTKIPVEKSFAVALKYSISGEKPLKNLNKKEKILNLNCSFFESGLTNTLGGKVFLKACLSDELKDGIPEDIRKLLVSERMNIIFSPHSLIMSSYNNKIPLEVRLITLDLFGVFSSVNLKLIKADIGKVSFDFDKIRKYKEAEK